METTEKMVINCRNGNSVELSKHPTSKGKFILRIEDANFKSSVFVILDKSEMKSICNFMDES